MRLPLLGSSWVLMGVVAVGCSKKASEAPPPAPPSATKPAKAAPDAPPAPAAAVVVAEAPAPKVNDAEPVDGEVTLKGPATAAAGSDLLVSFTGPANARDYVDLVPRGATEPGGELTYVYIKDLVAGTKLVALSKPGEYDLRYVLDLKSARKVKAVVPLTITPVTAQLVFSGQANGAEPISVQWTGPGGKGDYIDVVPAGFTATNGEITFAYTHDGNPATLDAPGPAGDYLVRYVQDAPGGRVVVATMPLKVTAAVATLTAPEQVTPGQHLVVEFTGPKRAHDYVDVVKKGYEPTHGELTFFYVADKNELDMPKERGAYELRYVMAAPGVRMVLTRRPITVK